MLFFVPCKLYKNINLKTLKKVHFIIHKIDNNLKRFKVKPKRNLNSQIQYTEDCSSFGQNLDKFFLHKFES